MVVCGLRTASEIMSVTGDCHSVDVDVIETWPYVEESSTIDAGVKPTPVL